MKFHRVTGVVAALSVVSSLAVGALGPVTSANAVVTRNAPNSTLSPRGYLYAPAPQLLGVTSAGYRVGNRYFQSVSASWSGVVARPTLRTAHTLHPRIPYFSVTYTCTLLVGFAGASSFTQTTSSRSCTFSNLSMGRSYGIAVRSVVDYGEGSATSLASQGFAPLPRVTYRCAKGPAVRVYATRTVVSCPAGWHLV